VSRAEVFRYVGLEVTSSSLRGHYELDGRHFSELIEMDGVGDLRRPAVVAVAELWHLLAGLSYYKAGAARVVDLAETPVGERGRELLRSALLDGLGEFAYRNQLDLDDVVVEGGRAAAGYQPSRDPSRVLIPFGGGIDSVVTVESLVHLPRSLFVVSPATGRFAPLEATAAVTGLDAVRATRHLDPQILRGDDNFFNGHVPVTAMVTLLAVIGALASGHGAVAMSNEHSASAPNLRWRDRDVNHQWSKSWAAEVLIAAAVAERIGDEFLVASYLRDRSELWVAQRFAELRQYHRVFRSCNRAFNQRVGERAASWCRRCDKCLFIDLVLAPFVDRGALRDIFGGEPLSDPRLDESLRALVGLGLEHKPFECVGDPDESAVALDQVSRRADWADVPRLGDLARLASPDRKIDELLEPQGRSRVPTHWLR
jgi:UDP-N-acetyl-alpha-D-muramoyl-L-alanyl-L-glutamate epimerase